MASLSLTLTLPLTLTLTLTLRGGAQLHPSQLQDACRSRRGQSNPNPTPNPNPNPNPKPTPNPDPNPNPGGQASEMEHTEEDSERGLVSAEGGEDESLLVARCVDYGGTVPPSPGVCCSSVTPCAAINKCMPYGTTGC